MDNQARAQQYREKLESFRKLFHQYAKEVFAAHRPELLDELRAQLQRLEPQITTILSEVLGDGSFSIGYSGGISGRDLLPSALMGVNNEMPHNFADFEGAVTSSLERALGTLEAGLWPPKEPTPVLVINDNELRSRCADLLAAPGNYDRVIREATVVLEDRIRHKVAHEVLARFIPNAADQTGENVVNHFFSPDKPVLIISSEKLKRIALHRILLGVISYLRNPSHHRLDQSTEWSWAWSTVGFVDKLDLFVKTPRQPGARWG